MCNKKKEKKDYVEELEDVVDKLRNQVEEKDQQLEKIKSNIAENKSTMKFVSSHENVGDKRQKIHQRGRMDSKGFYMIRK